MNPSSPITTLFLDIGGVLLTNGWDHNERMHAAEKFGLDYEEMNERHHLIFATYEEDKLSLDEYLNRVVFYQERSFSREEFTAFMYAQSQPFPEMIELMRGLRTQHGLSVAAVSNEGRELTVYIASNNSNRELSLTSLFRRALSTTASPMQTCTELPWTLLKCARNK